MAEERKLVTILFADVSGSTALGEALDPEDVRMLMTRYFDHARQVVAEHGGTVEKFIGDAVMAVFGLAQAHGDDAERALAAALALRDKVADDAVLAGRFVLRMGVHTGQVIATDDRTRGDFLVTGDAVNVAARLEQHAQPGEIVTSRRTADAARAAFLFGRRRLVTAKGKSRRLEVYPLTGPRPVRLVGRPPLVGRRRELAQLDLLREAVLEERRPQLVSIVAPAGTGKTRLLEEFLARLDPADGFQVATARCLPYGDHLTYWPLRGLLEGLLGGAFSHERVTQAFTRMGHSADDATWLADRVLATLGIERDGHDGQSSDGDRTSIFGAWRLLVEAQARETPRILVFEDLHWASESLLDLVEHIMSPRTQAAVLLVALSRPELLDRRPSWGGGQRNFTSLALEPLREDQTRELVGRLAKGLHGAALLRVAERSGGNPFFAIELARSVTERGLTGLAASDDGLPDTVHEAVLERLDRLTPTERGVLQVATVAGRTFRPDMLRALVGAPVASPLAEKDLDAVLGDLLARDLIVPTEDGQYTFRHLLFRDVAYGTLPRAERIRLHAQVAAWLERFAAGRLDEFTELIAYHYREAVLLARQSAVAVALPVDALHAVHFLVRAGELASQSGAFLEARDYLQSAIALAPENERGRLYEALGDNVHQVLRDTGAAAYREALARWRADPAATDDSLTGARRLRKLLIAYLRWGATRTDVTDWRELEEMQTEARRLAEAAGDEEEVWRVRLMDLLWLYWRDGVPTEDIARGREVARAAADYFEAHANWTAFSEALDIYTSLSIALAEHADALTAAQRRLAIPDLPAAERGDAVSTIVRGYFNVGDYERCLATAHEALEQVRPGESTLPLGLAVSLAATVAWYGGRWDELATFLDAARDAWDQSEHELGRGWLMSYLIALHVAMARDDQAAADAAAATLHALLVEESTDELARLVATYQADDADKLLCPPLAHWTENTRYPETLMFLSERDLRAPRELLDAAAAEAYVEQVPFPLLCLAIAEALAADDDEQLAAALEEAERGGVVAHVARMRIVLAQRSGDHAQLERARPVLQRLGDRQFLRRLEEVANRMSMHPGTPFAHADVDHELAPGAPGAAAESSGRRRRVRRSTEA
ncbi:MAG TPA: adenylate/guanylate cyclase domain-containing protein [Ktedonobacterales bacterium]